MSQQSKPIAVKSAVLHATTEAAGIEGGVSLNKTKNPNAVMTIQDGLFLRVENTGKNGVELPTVLIPLTNVKFVILA